MKYLKQYESIIAVAIVLIAGIVIAFPLFENGWFPMHDDAQIARVLQIAKGLRVGHIPVRWAPDLGYGFGYPIFNFYAPLPYYIGGLLTLIGLSGLLATKIMIALGLILSGLSMYILSKKLWGTWAGVLSSVLYLYAPYHATDIYVRGAIGELYAFVFIPLIVYGILKIVQEKIVSKWSVTILSTSYAGLILSHNISALVSTIIIGVAGIAVVIWYFVTQKKQKKAKQKLLLVMSSLLLGLGLSAFFWIPALLEQSYTNIEKVVSGDSQYFQHFLYIDQLWDSPWGFAGSAEGRADGMSFKIGKFHIALGVFGMLSILYLWYRKRLSMIQKVTAISIISVLIMSILMTIQISQPLWDMLPQLAFIQFPWRFLVWILFSLSLVSGAVVLLFPKTIKILLVLFLGFVVIAINLKYFVPESYFVLSQKEYESSEYLGWYVSKQSDEYMPPYFPIPETKYDIATKRFTTTNELKIDEKGSEYNKFLTFSAKEEDKLLINIAVYPVWEFMLNGEYVVPEIINGVYAIPIRVGDQQSLSIRYSTTPIAFVANLVTIVSIALLFGTIVGIPKKPCLRKKRSK